ncbi:hypothetical protein TNCV_4004861 [Trichonephila clavipes]|nr:hypothetical protein TNCV_4004861 [Trichonephila clavipes]
MSTKLASKLTLGASRQTDHLTGTSAHAPQDPRSLILVKEKTRKTSQVLWVLWARIIGNSFPTKSKKRDVKKKCK